jgi:hypothetical protein
MARTWEAVSSDITRRTVRGGSSWTTSPLLSAQPLTRRGFISMPPLAKAEKAMAICRGVVEISWPKAMVAWVRPLHFPTALSNPLSSAGSPRPVFMPMPKERMYL